MLSVIPKLTASYRKREFVLCISSSIHWRHLTISNRESLTKTGVGEKNYLTVQNHCQKNTYVIISNDNTALAYILLLLSSS